MPKSDNDNPLDIDQLIQRLLLSKRNDVKMEPYEIRQVCIKARDIFLQEPMLLTLRAPIKICGNPYLIQAISMDNIVIYFVFLIQEVFPRNSNTSFLAIMLIVVKIDCNALFCYFSLR